MIHLYTHHIYCLYYTLIYTLYILYTYIYTYTLGALGLTGPPFSGGVRIPKERGLSGPPVKLLDPQLGGPIRPIIYGLTGPPRGLVSPKQYGLSGPQIFFMKIEL